VDAAFLSLWVIARVLQQSVDLSHHQPLMVVNFLLLTFRAPAPGEGPTTSRG
jgi:hypothetical protein